jgi:hypothetical protein
MRLEPSPHAKRVIVNALPNLVPRACDPREGTRGSGIIRCQKPGILAKIELRIPFQRPIRFLPETDYPRDCALPKVVGFLRVLRFPPTGKVDRVG